jgi:hypothetical protein
MQKTSAASRSQGRAYRKPTLTVLGDLASLTKTVGTIGNLDGGNYYGYALHSR